jgi:hypothetical protein
LQHNIYTMMKKIQVLLIDDYPAFALTKVKNISAFKGLELQPNQLEKTIPSIEEYESEKREISNDSVLKPSSVTVEIEKIQFAEYFELKWLRNSDDIQLYRKLCQNVEEEFSSTRLGEVDGFVPEVVLFDYALTGHEDKSFPNETDDMEILQRSVPTYNLKKMLSENGETNLDFTIEPLDLSVFEIEKGLNSDNIGCVGGILTVSYFRNHPCIGIATTRKSDEHLKGQEAKFVEGLVKEPHQFDFTLRGNIENLNWEILLKRAADNLRKRITILVQSSKITPSLSQLMELASGVIVNRTFSFNSIYGERVLPLDGLFIDEPESIRDEKIKTWAAELLEKMPLINSVIKKSIDLSTQLWNAYLNCFEDRMVLSDYTYRLAELNSDEKKYLIEVKKSLDVDATTGLIPDKLECSVKSFLNGEKDIDVKRLVVLITVTNAAIELEKQRTESGMSGKYAPLSNWEYFNILFPKVNLKEKLLLPMHYKSETDKSSITEADRKWLFRNLTTKENKVTEANLFLFADWINRGEKEVLKSIFYYESKYFPEWLK